MDTTKEELGLNGLISDFYSKYKDKTTSNKINEIINGAKGSELDFVRDLYQSIGKEINDGSLDIVNDAYFPKSNTLRKASFAQSKQRLDFNASIQDVSKDMDSTLKKSEEEPFSVNIGSPIQKGIDTALEKKTLDDSDYYDAIYSLQDIDNLQSGKKSIVKDGRSAEEFQKGVLDLEKQLNAKEITTADYNKQTETLKNEIFGYAKPMDEAIYKSQKSLYEQKVNDYLTQKRNDFDTRYEQVKKQAERERVEEDRKHPKSNFMRSIQEVPDLNGNITSSELQLVKLNSVRKNLDKIETLASAPSGNNWKAFTQGIKDTDLASILSLGVTDAIQSIQESGALERVANAQKKGQNPDPLDFEMVGMHSMYQKLSSVKDPSVIYQIGASSVENMSFIAQLVLTSGAGKFAQKALLDFALNKAKTKAAKLGVKGVGTLSRAGTQAALLPQNTILNASERQKGNYKTDFQIMENEDGSPVLDPQGNPMGRIDVKKIGDESLGLSAAIGYGQNLTEVFTEQLGDNVFDPLLGKTNRFFWNHAGKAASKIPYFTKIGTAIGDVGNYMNNKTPFIAGVGKRLYEAGNVNTLVAENLEEGSSKVINNFLPMTAEQQYYLDKENEQRMERGEKPITRWEDFWDAKEALVILGSTLVLSGARTALATADLANMRINLTKKSVEIPKLYRTQIVEAMSSENPDIMLEKLRTFGIEDIADQKTRETVVDYINAKMQYDVAVGNTAGKKAEGLITAIKGEVENLVNMSEEKIHIVEDIDGNDYVVLAGEIGDGTGVLSVREIKEDAEAAMGYSSGELMQIATGRLKKESLRKIDPAVLSKKFLDKRLPVIEAQVTKEVEDDTKQQMLEAEQSKYEDIVPHEKIVNKNEGIEIQISDTDSMYVENGEGVSFGVQGPDGMISVVHTGERGAAKHSNKVSLDVAKRIKYELKNPQTSVSSTSTSTEEQASSKENKAVVDEQIETKPLVADSSSKIPTDDKGNLLYEEAPAESTAESFIEDFGEDALMFVEATLDKVKKDLNSMIDKDGKPKRTGYPNIDRSNYKKIKSSQRVLDYWKSVYDIVNGQQKTVEAELAEVFVEGESTEMDTKQEQKLKVDGARRTVKKTNDKVNTKQSDFQKRLCIIEEYLDEIPSMRGYILYNIANGNYRFDWIGGDINVGLAKELGFLKDGTERKKRIGILKNGAWTPNSLAEYLYSSPENVTNMTESDIKNEILNILQSVYSKKDAIEKVEYETINRMEVERDHYYNILHDEAVNLGIPKEDVDKANTIESIETLVEDYKKRSNVILPAPSKTPFVANGANLTKVSGIKRHHNPSQSITIDNIDQTDVENKDTSNFENIQEGVDNFSNEQAENPFGINLEKNEDIPFREVIDDGKNNTLKKRKEAIAQAAEDLVSKLNIAEHVVFVEDTSMLPERNRKSKGWFSILEGKIYVIMPNATSIADVAQTIWHESIAHYGLRAMFGERFNDFLRSSYAQADSKIKKRIEDKKLAYKNDDISNSKTDEKHLLEAIEETLADIAETNFNAKYNNFIYRLYRDFIQWLHSLGIGNIMKLGLEDFRYTLWCSNNYLSNKTAWQGLEILSKGMAMRKNLQDRKIQDKTISNELSQAEKEIGTNPNQEQGEERNDLFRRVELDKIKDEAVHNNTYLKAPNGKATNLNPEQWVQVRTKEFKDWFGDWEKAARIEKLRNSKSIEITGEEYREKYELNRDSVRAWMKGNLRGPYINNDTKETIIISKIGVNKVTSHGEREVSHLQSIIAIPEMIRTAVFIEEIINEKDNSKYDSYRYYVCGIKINDIDYTARIVVGVKGESKYYDHSLTEIEKGNLINNLSRETNSVAENQAILSEYKDKRLLSILQTNSSKVVDENGEPMVVYHGTDDSFTAFKYEELKRVEGSFFFAQNIKEAKDYRGVGNVMKVFFNIRNPADFENLAQELYKLSTKREIVDALKERGYDGWMSNMEDGYGEISAFYSTQIKSATDNIGIFDNENDDIRFREKNVILEQAHEYLDSLKERVTLLGEKNKNNKTPILAGDVVKNWNEPLAKPKPLFAGDVLFRKSITLEPKDTSLFVENHIDSDIAIKNLQDFIVRSGGKIVNGRSNVYDAKNHSTSRIMDASLKFEEEVMLPLLESAKKIVKVSGTTLYILNLYTMAKHMPHRNETMRKDAVDAINKEVVKLQERLEKINEEKKSTEQKISIKEAKDIINEIAKLGKQRKRVANKDFAGVTEFEKVSSMSPEQYVEWFESGIDEKEREKYINEYWGNIKRATDYAIDYRVETGLLSASQGEEIKYKWEYYVPLRGWDTEEVGANELRYVKKGKGIRNVFKRAEGRTSLAADPIANIQNLALASIKLGEENRYKLTALNLAEDNAEFVEQFHIKQIYYVKSSFPNEDGEYYYEMVTEKPSKLTYAEGRVLTEKQRRTSKQEQKQHIVEVQDNGRTYHIAFKNPEIANSINKSNMDDKYLGTYLGKFTRWLTQNMTSKNPAFAVSNFVKDAEFVTTTFAIEKGAAYSADFLKNYRYLVSGFMWKYAMGRPIGDTEIERLFNEWTKRGGRTGFTAMKSLGDIIKDVKKSVEGENATRFANPIFYIEKLGDAFEVASTVSENATRFAVFLTTLQAQNKIGNYTEEDYFTAITDSKNCSTNFDRRGTKTKNFNALYGFFNATVQSSMRILNVARKHKGKYIAVAAIYAAMGYIEALVNCAEDEDFYMYQSDYAKATYLIFCDIKIWLPFHFRAFKNIGVQAYLMSMGKRDKTEAVVNMLKFSSAEMLPDVVDLASYFTYNEVGKGIDFDIRSAVPTAAVPFYDIAVNENFMGRPIFRSTGNKEADDKMPDVYKASKNVFQPLYSITKFLAEDIGGLHPALNGKGKSMVDATDKYGASDIHPLLDWNASKIEHLIVSLFAGRGKFAVDVCKIAENIIDMAISEEGVDFEFENIPVFNRFYVPKDEERVMLKSYYEFKEEITYVNDLFNKRYNVLNSPDPMDIKKYGNYTELATDDIEVIIDNYLFNLSMSLDETIKSIGEINKYTELSDGLTEDKLRLMREVVSKRPQWELIKKLNSGDITENEYKQLLKEEEKKEYRNMEAEK